MSLGSWTSLPSTPVVIESAPTPYTILSARGVALVHSLKVPDPTFAQSGTITLFSHRSWSVAAGDKARMVGPLDLFALVPYCSVLLVGQDRDESKTSTS
jgi:hypothetical protein